MRKIFIASRKASTAGFGWSLSSTEKSPEAPVKSRFQSLWPGKLGRAGYSTRATSGRVSSQEATLIAFSWCPLRRTWMVRSPRKPR